MTLEWRGRTLVITWLPVASMGRLAACAPQTAAETEVLAALLAGARVRVERDALEYRRYRRTAPPWHLSEMRRSGAAPAGDGYLCCWDRWPVRSGPQKKSPALTGQAFLTVRVGERLLVCADCVGAGEGETVLVATGGAARVAAGAELPIDAAIVGILDES